jgi:hypothetical protein
VRDHHLPETENELRDWIVEAWWAGWRARRALMGKPAGTVSVACTTQRAAFLASWDLPPEPTPPVVPVREAIQRMAESKD